MYKFNKINYFIKNFFTLRLIKIILFIISQSYGFT